MHALKALEKLQSNLVGCYLLLQVLTWNLRNRFSKRSQVYSPKHIPGRTRPARPRRCFADACHNQAPTTSSPSWKTPRHYRTTAVASSQVHG